MGSDVLIDTDFPGANAVVERIDADAVYLRQDLRDTAGDWFYWAFRARAEAGQAITVRFTAGDVLGPLGPAASFDHGRTWQWLGDACVCRQGDEPVSFTFTFPPGAREALLALCPIYTQRELERFLQRVGPGIQRDVLCQSRDGREVERLTIGNDSASFRVLLTARHHACEAMASYCLEGILQSALADDALGEWLRRHVRIVAIPFIDKAGVEAGDQGKNRRPYDHNRDYGGPSPDDSIYPEVRALRRWAPQWLAQRAGASLVLDLHCPWIRGGRNEEVYFVSSPVIENWQRVLAFSSILEAACAGPIRFRASNNLPFGQEWNTLDRGDAIGARTCGRWAATLPTVRFATTLEIPYARAGGSDVTPDSARALGRDVAAAIRGELLATRVTQPR